MQLFEEEYFHKADNLVRTSAPVLQSLFCERWKRSTGLPWSSFRAEQFITGFGKKVYNFSAPDQKELLQSGVLEEWDVILLSKALLSFPATASPSTSTEVETSFLENEGIRSLMEMSNNLAHSGRTKLSPAEYQEIEVTFKQSLFHLQVPEIKIETLITQAGVTSFSAALEQSKKIQADAIRAATSENFEEAIKLFEDALQIPSLLPVNLSTIYELKADSTLKLAVKLKSQTNVSSDLLKQAQISAEAALEHNSNSWKAHHVLGKVLIYTHNFPGAILHFRRALSLAPDKMEVLDDLQSCKLLAGEIDKEDGLDPGRLPMTYEDRLESLCLNQGVTTPEDEFQGNLYPGQRHVIKGHQFLNGWNVLQDFQQAANHYSKAVKKNNAEGMFHLGWLYRDGRGLQQDIPRALDLWQKAARLPPKIKIGTKFCEDVGVYKAQHALGIMYSHGIGVKKDLQQAHYWFKLGAENGSKIAAHNLALMYYHGDGVEQDEKLAVSWWNVAVERRYKNAARALCIFYCRQMEPNLARANFEEAIRLGDERLEGIRDPVEKLLKEIEDRRAELEGTVVTFENSRILPPVKDITFLERMERMMVVEDPTVCEALKEVRAASKRTRILEGMVDGEKFNEKELVFKKAGGSETASRILRTIHHYLEFIRLWCRKTRGGHYPLEEADEKEIIDELFNWVPVDAHLVKMPGSMFEDVFNFLQGFLKRNGAKPSDLDRKVRLSFAYFSLAKGLEENILEILKEGLRRYPEELQFYLELTNVYGLFREHKKGLAVTDKGLHRFPGNAELWYAKAVHLRLDKQFPNQDKVREAHLRFLEFAPNDHRHVPDALYCIGVSYMQTKRVEVEKAKEFFKKGKVAEERQMKCYLPYVSTSKTLLEALIQEAEGKSKKIVKPDLRAYLQDPKRILLLRSHRECLKQVREEAPPTMFKVVMDPPKLRIPPVSELRGISLRDMDQTRNHTYENSILKLTLIDEPLLGLPSVHLIAQDDFGVVTNLHVYNVEQDEESRKTFGFGCRLSVIHPYMRMFAMKGANGIRVDDPKTLIFEEGVENMCRYCGEEGAMLICARCKWAKYCSKKCQVADWKVINHKVICKE